MTSAGIDHTTSSIGPEYSKVGRYCARLLDARNHQAQPSTSTITGMMIASMIAVAFRRIRRSAAPIGPCGSSTPVCQMDCTAPPPLCGCF